MQIDSSRKNCFEFVIKGNPKNLENLRANIWLIAIFNAFEQNM
jgi:hypothetical protein